MMLQIEGLAIVKTIADFVAPAYDVRRGIPLLMCLYTGRALPRFAQAMPRSPSLPLGAVLDSTFPRSYHEVLSVNPEAHDGAVLAGRTAVNLPYAVTGWSYRLYPPELKQSAIPNRGSAFLSCRAMSALPEVDAVILFSRSERTIFLGGEVQESQAVA